jgi:hypothetical protein
VFLPLIGAGIVLVSVAVFWAAIQNWLADLVHRASGTLGPLTYSLQSALVVVDQAVVNGQRLFTATLKAIFRTSDARDAVSIEEVRSLTREQVPADVLAKLETGQALQYELSIESLRVKHAPTYRLVVRSAE